VFSEDDDAGKADGREQGKDVGGRRLRRPVAGRAERLLREHDDVLLR
jgi:hypothetical protein